MRHALTLAAVLSTAALTADAASLLVNGDFEDGNSGFSSDLAYSPTNGGIASVYHVATDPKAWFSSFASFGDHTTGSGNMMMMNGSSTAGTTIWSQTVTVLEDTAYDFTGWMSAIFPSSSELTAQINDANLGIIDGPADTGIWERFAFSWNSGSATTATVSVLQGSGPYFNNDYALDDLSFSGRDVVIDPSPVPLPASLPLLFASLGGMVALRRLRRRG